MQISILTPCFNASQTIHATIESFLRQDHPEKEMLILDGGSTDETLEIVRAYADESIVVRSAQDQGMYDALNTGLEMFSGDAFGVLNADDTYSNSSVLSQIAERLENSDAVHGNLRFVKDHVSKEVVRSWKAEERPASGFRAGWMPAHPTFYARRTVADAVGRFNLSYNTAADYDWMLRAIDVHQFKASLVDSCLVDMMVGGRSTSSLRSHLEHNLESLKSRRKWLGSGPVDFALIGKPFRKVAQLFPRSLLDPSDMDGR